MVGLIHFCLQTDHESHRSQLCWPSSDLHSLRFTEADIKACVEQIRLEKRWIRREEIAARMWVKVTLVTKWVSTGLLTPVATHANSQHFSRDEVDAFVQGHIFSDEAARILDVGLDVVQKWARKGRLKPVAGGSQDDCHRYLFRREDVERLRPENRLTGPQLAKRLGLSRAQLWQWSKQGKVKPVSGPGIDESGHYLFVLSENVR